MKLEFSSAVMGRRADYYNTGCSAICDAEEGGPGSLGTALCHHVDPGLTYGNHSINIYYIKKKKRTKRDNK